MSMDVVHSKIRKTALPRTGRALDAVGKGGGGAGIFMPSWGDSGSSVDIDSVIYIDKGKGIDVSRKTIGGRLVYTISHDSTSLEDTTDNKGDIFVQNLILDDFGHVTGIESVRITESLDERYLRKDINDTAHGIILFDQKIGSSVFLDGWDGKGWEITDGGAGLLDSLRVRSDIFLGGRLGSDTFVSGFPNGYGWEVTPYQRTNSAGTEETRYRLEIDDINVRGRFRAYEFVISQLRGENDNVIFAGMMRVDHYDASTGRIYLDTENGVLYNPFHPGDILMVQRFGGMPSGDNDYNIIKQYELRVDQAGIGGLSDGEERLDWITFVNLVGDLSDIAEGDVLTRVDSVADSTRKGSVKVTTIDEIGAPYIDVVYGMRTDPENATKARVGNLTGIRTKSGVDLTGVWGIYGNGAYFENSTYILDNGNTIEQQFSIINGTLESTIGEIRNDMSLEPGNILRNSSFSRDTNYWEAGGTVSLWSFDTRFIYANDTFISEKENFAGIYQDGGRNVLRINDSYVLQRNEVMDIPVREEGDEDWTYSFSFFYKVVRAGTLTAGFSGSTLYLSQQLQPTDEYQKLSKVAEWNESGDFKITFTGEILIYGVSLYNDALADAEIRLQTQITQNATLIALKADKTYVDDATGEIYEHFNSQFTVTAEQISGISTHVDNIEQTIETAGWITEATGNQLFAKKEMENGDTIISTINQTPTSIKIQAEHVELQGAVSFSMLSDYTTVNNRLNNIESAAESAGNSATDALEEALDAWERANNAYNRADDAYDRGDSAYNRASTAINNAASALTAANNAQSDVDSLPSWSKQASIIKALQDATIIIGGYISTSYIDTDTLSANLVKVGNFTINNGALEGQSEGNERTSIKVGYATIGRVVQYSENWDGYFLSLFVEKLGNRFARIDNIEAFQESSVDFASPIYMNVLNVPSQINLLNMNNGDKYIRMGIKQFSNDSSGNRRTFIRVNNMPSVTQVNTEATGGRRFTVKWDEKTGLLYIE